MLSRGVVSQEPRIESSALHILPVTMSTLSLQEMESQSHLEVLFLPPPRDSKHIEETSWASNRRSLHVAMRHEAGRQTFRANRGG